MKDARGEVMRHEEIYKGCGIAVETFRRHSRYGWCYRIEGGAIRENATAPLNSQSVMLFEAIAKARAEIDAMLWSGLG